MLKIAHVKLSQNCRSAGVAAVAVIFTTDVIVIEIMDNTCLIGKLRPSISRLIKRHRLGGR